MTMTRRGFLSASALAAAAPLFGARAWGAPLPREADIVVIGAGAAGIAAARRIMAANRRVIVVEAAGQIGGQPASIGQGSDRRLPGGTRTSGHPAGNGASETQTVSTQDPHTEQTASSVNAAQFAQYEKLSEQATEDENLPVADRQMIKRYFEDIRPQASP